MLAFAFSRVCYPWLRSDWIMETEIYIVRDNGKRSFIPPCFCWDLTPVASGEAATTVSEIDLSHLGLSSEEESLRRSLALGELQVKGFIQPSGVPSTGLQEGRTLVVLEVLGSP